MILARLSTAIREQNWFAVTLEFVIVIAGVVIGFQITNWAQQQREIELGESFAEDLLDDLHGEAFRGRFQVEYYGAVHHHALRAIDLFDSEDPQQDSDFIVAIYNATQHVGRAQLRAAYDELVATGNLRLIPDRELANRAVANYMFDYRAFIAGYVRGSALRDSIRRTVPYRIQTAINEQCGDTLDATGQIDGLRRDCELDLPADDIRLTAQLIRSHPTLRGDLQVYVGELGVRYSNLQASVSLLIENLCDYQSDLEICIAAAS
ncbi:hypothetical protein [Hyphobacterium sp.]|uniref:hypothetical protein n=1 Tax=Hyphobacterium sp. TaxID=2004662 RepID=UPI003BAAB0C5